MLKKIHLKAKILLQFILSIFLSLYLVLPTNAALSETTLNFFAENDIFYYNPSGFVSGMGCYSGDINIYGSAAAEKVWSGLTTFLTPEQAAGVMGNMKHESNSLNPLQHEGSFKSSWQNGFNILTDASKSYGIGLIQWSGSRRVDLFNYIQEKAPHLIQYFQEPDTYGRFDYAVNGNKALELVGESVFDQLIQVELEFLRNELETGYRGIFDQHTVSEASDYFLYHVEIPNDPGSKRNERFESSQAYYDQLIGTDLSSSTSGSHTCSGLASGGVTDVEAQAIMDEYHQLQIEYADCHDSHIIGSVVYCSPYHVQKTGCSGGPLSNCVAFSQYFINRYTTYANKEGGIGGLPNGVDVVNTLLSREGFTDGGTEPRAYAIFSKPGPSAAGHTGVVLRVDLENNIVLVGEAGCSAYDWTGVHTYSLDEMRSGTYTYAYTDNILLLN